MKYRETQQNLDNCNTFEADLRTWAPRWFLALPPLARALVTLATTRAVIEYLAADVEHFVPAWHQAVIEALEVGTLAGYEAAVRTGLSSPSLIEARVRERITDGRARPLAPVRQALEKAEIEDFIS